MTQDILVTVPGKRRSGMLSSSDPRLSVLLAASSTKIGYAASGIQYTTVYAGSGSQKGDQELVLITCAVVPGAKTAPETARTRQERKAIRVQEPESAQRGGGGA
eukprot:2079648-Rhodomonas_salina.1